MLNLSKRSFSSTLFSLAVLALISALSSCAAISDESDSIVIVDNKQPKMTIVVAENASEYTNKAAEKLNHYIEEISEAQLPVVHRLEDAKTSGIVWIGAHPQLSEKHPNVDFSIKESEETLIQTAGQDIVILGSDIVADDGTQTEAGTNLAVSSFIENQLGVRWLWPGKYGTDIPQSATIRVKELSVRYTPQLHYRNPNLTTFARSYSTIRKIKDARKEYASYTENASDWAREKDVIIRDWLNNHRSDARISGDPPRTNAIGGSLATYRNTHEFTRWYYTYGYGKEHPEWFALQPDGTRNPYPKNYPKMCISNPEVAEEWVKIAKKYFEENPNATTYSAAENDHGWEGYCTCEQCLAWDNKNAEKLEREIRWENESKVHYALTDRYAKFWNIVAKRLKEEFPNRDVNVSTYAYHVTRPAPTIKLEDNIIPAFVGLERRSYQRNNMEETLDQRRIWKGWWEASNRKNSIIWRPNITYMTIGLPYIFTKRHAENMRFMAEHGLLGLVFDGGTSKDFATMGPQLYLMVKTAWDPYLDEKVLLQDYYQRGFGPAAPFIEQYYQNFEDLYAKFAEQYKNQGYSSVMDPPRLFREIRLDSQPATGRLGEEGIKKHNTYEKKAEQLLKEAAAAVQNSDQIYRDRVQFVQTGFDFIQAQLDTIEAVNNYREEASQSNLELIKDAAKRRSEVLKKQTGTFAINELGALSLIYGRWQQYLAPPATDKAPQKQTKEKEAKDKNDFEA